LTELVVKRKILRKREDCDVRRELVYARRRKVLVTHAINHSRATEGGYVGARLDAAAHEGTT
jgi:hypothetical protein